MNPDPSNRAIGYRNLSLCFAVILGFWTHACMAGSAGGQNPSGETKRALRGGLNRLEDADRPQPVRNDVAQPGREIVTLRHFRIAKGTFDEFLTASAEGVWPYFEKLGARVIGMWKVTVPADLSEDAPRIAGDFDEVYLATRYASFAHWKASRDTVKHGGNGPDWQKCKAALALRRRVTLATDVKFLEGRMAPNGPYFMPGLEERYELAEPAAAARPIAP